MHFHYVAFEHWLCAVSDVPSSEQPYPRQEGQTLDFNSSSTIAIEESSAHK